MYYNYIGTNNFSNLIISLSQMLKKLSINDVLSMNRKLPIADRSVQAQFT